jgi:alanine racemase
MSLSRRQFVGAIGTAPLLTAAARAAREQQEVVPAAPSPVETARVETAQATDPARMEPWIVVQPAALRANVGTLSRLAGGRPLMAVIKNNGYGLGLREVAGILEADARVSGFGVVKSAEALALREAGIRKPILLLALWDESEGETLVRHDVTLSLCVPDAPARAARAAERAGRAARVQCYVDTGMSRMGLSWRSALPVVQQAAQHRQLLLSGMLTELTEDRAFDTEQVRRLQELATQVRAAGVSLGGPLHAASSHAVFNHADTLLEAVRPGISLFGAYPTDEGSERSIAGLQVALSLRARVVRVEQLRVGDTVSYGRRFRADAPTWIATIPVGHADGYPRRAVNGCKVLIGSHTYPVIGAVSASHCIVNLGADNTVRVGDVCVLVGPEHPEIHPNAIAVTAGVSVYDVLMHLAQGLPRLVG